MPKRLNGSLAVLVLALALFACTGHAPLASDSNPNQSGPGPDPVVAGAAGAAVASPGVAGRTSRDPDPPTAGRLGSAGTAASRPRPGPAAGAPAAGSGGTGTAPAGDGTCPKDLAVPAICRLCNDGSCAAPFCANGQLADWKCAGDAASPMPVDCDCGREANTPVCGTDGKRYDATCGRSCVPVSIACDGECPCRSGGGCVIGGCSGQLCSDAANGGLVSTCEFRDEYACYRTARCEPQSNGACGWTQTPALQQCLANPSSSAGP